MLSCSAVLVQTGSLLLNAVSPSQVTIQVPQALTGFNTVLNASSLTTTPVAAGAGCAYIAFASSAPVDAFMSTYDDFVSLVTDRWGSTKFLDPQYATVLCNSLIVTSQFKYQDKQPLGKVRCNW